MKKNTKTKRIKAAMVYCSRDPSTGIMSMSAPAEGWTEPSYLIKKSELREMITSIAAAQAKEFYYGAGTTLVNALFFAFKKHGMTPSRILKPAANMKSVRKAIKRAQPGDTVLIKQGKYDCSQ